MKVKGKRVLKNGVLAGYVRQNDGTWKWRFLKGPIQKNMRGGDPNIPIVERTTTLNLRKFLNAFINGKFLSPNRGALKSFEKATGGNDYISLSIPKSRASKLYSHKGITFIMDTNTIHL